MTPLVSEIQQATARHFGVSMIDLLSQRRSRDVARPRQVAMYLCRMLTVRSFPEIGSLFGDRDHTTVMHAVKVIRSLVREDPELERAVSTISRQIAVIVSRRSRQRDAAFEVAA